MFAVCFPLATTDIQSVPLNWAPTKIIHSPLEDDPFEMVVLVGGSDSRVHLFVQDAPDVVPSDGLFKEQPVENHFSVLASFSYCEYWYALATCSLYYNAEQIRVMAN
jgi:hypothetical protein